MQVAEASLSVARLTLLQSAIDLLKTCPEGFLDGQALSNQLRELHPEHVAEVAAGDPKARKGWLRQLLANEPLILQLLPPGRKGTQDVCYTLQHQGNVPPGLSGAKFVDADAAIPEGPGASAKRKTAPASAAVPATKKPKWEKPKWEKPKWEKPKWDPKHEDISVVADRIPWGPKTEILTAAAEAIRSVAHLQDHLEGNKIAILLKEQCLGSVTLAQEAVGGKGWLRVILETSEDFTRVDVPGKAEPCYRLADGSMAALMAQPAHPAYASSAVAVPRRVPPKGKGQRPAIAAVQAQKGAQMVPQAQVANFGALQPLHRQLIQACVQIVSGAERGFLEGSRLSEQLRNFFPNEVVQAKATLGDKTGKGWLKKLLEAQNTIQVLQVDGCKEPCYCLASQAHHAAAMAQAYAGSQAMKASQQQMMAAQKGAAAPAAAWKGASKGAKQQAPEASGASLAGAEEFIPYLLEAAVAQLSSVPEYMQGTFLAEALKLQYSEAVDKTKAALGGKGWLKKVLEQDHRIAAVKVHGLNEPCYALAARCAGGQKEFVKPQVPKKERPPAPNGEAWTPRQGPPTGENVLERISGEDASELYNSAVAILEAVGAGPNSYLEGSKLAEKMKEMNVDLVTRVKTTLRKGWLKAVLELQPRIQAVEVDGRNEPCYRLAA